MRRWSGETRGEPEAAGESRDSRPGDRTVTVRLPAALYLRRSCCGGAGALGAPGAARFEGLRQLWGSSTCGAPYPAG
ncbi:hypothetical protein NDU88_003854 [Pleurodeles waltl]|uniref:Uncharacterized protein n=1 Tax=Pleurodeles waltl TaxID=8319 RepID=A0AAV7UDQ0_PLEWA|nr:hypothetical protein NDU88_003854 [Pleurodeles waltl]